MTEPARVVFLHSPKTAGTTVRGLLRRIYGRGYFAIGPDPAASLARIDALPAAEREQLRAVAGHVAYGVHAHLPGPWRTFTLVRHPIERILSHYGYSLRDAGAPLHAAIVSGEIGLREYVTDYEHARHFNNGQVRLLGGDARVDPDGQEPATPRHLALALERLEDGSLTAGTTERFDASLLLLAELLRWPTPRYRSEKVAAQRIRRDEIDSETLRAIVEHNALDRELYRAVAERLDGAIEERGPRFPARLARFRVSNRARLRAYDSARALRRRLLRAGRRRVARRRGPAGG